ncbi:MAG: M20/M25/M40 family metallo-hydrolase [Bacillota bacterium]
MLPAETLLLMGKYTFLYDWSPRVEGLTRWLVETPSVVGTEGEVTIARNLYDMLSSWPYFQQHPDYLRLCRTHDDTRERYNVIALVRGQRAPAAGARTVLLMGHFDTVDIQDYGPLMHLACRPEPLAAATGAPAGYMVGRGSLDMKSGDAAHLAVLERFAAGEGPQELSLLLALSPDEEDSSHGILSVVADLPELSREWGLDLIAAINTDYTAPRYPGDPARYIYAGTIGKLLPSLFVAGLETHAGQPFGGFDPNWLVAEVTRRVDYNPDLCESELGEVTPPPVSLKLTDLKEAYTVQTPLYSWAYFNWFTFRRSPAEVLELFKGLVADAFAHLHTEFSDRAARHAALGGTRSPVTDWLPQVYTYAELVEKATERVGADYPALLAERLSQQPGIDLRSLSCRMTEELWQASGLRGPAAVVGYAQIYSAPMALDPDTPLMRAVRRATDGVAAETGEEIQVRAFFPYISDMSFLGFPDGPEGLAALRENSPGWGTLYRVDHEAHARLSLPVVNIGPYGEGAHTRHERVEKGYSFAVVPELIWRTLEAL